MPTQIKLELLMEKLLKRLMMGVFLIVLLVFIVFAYLIIDYRNEARIAFEFEKNLFKLQQQVSKVNIDVDIWRLNPHVINQSQLVDDWQMIYTQLNKIKILESKAKLVELKKLLLRLEIRHKRFVDIIFYDLYNPQEKLFNEKILPHKNEIFMQLTALVNASFSVSNIKATKIAADLRGYFTKAQGLLSELSRKKSTATWLEFNQTILQVKKNISAASSLKIGTKEYNDILNNIIAQYPKFLHNVAGFKQLSVNVRYYDLDDHKLQVNNLNKLIDNEVSRINNQYYIHLEKLEKNLLVMIVISLILTIIILLLGYRQLIQWKVAFTYNISHPITVISQKSKQIAVGETGVLLSAKSNVKEINTLIQAVDGIKDIVANNIRKSEAKQKVQRYKELINQLQYVNKDFDDLVTQTFDIVIEFTKGLAAAFYCKTNNENSDLALMNTFTISERKLTIGQKMREELLEQVSKSKQVIFYDLTDKRFSVESAFVTLYPSQLCLYPLLDGLEIVGVLELALPELDQSEQADLLEVLERFSTVIISQLNVRQTQQLLDVTQTQQIKLSETMDELQHQHLSLQRSEAELEVQADELKLANTQLKKQNEEADYNQKRLAELNATLKKTSAELKKASELKSQFLSKVSHELRTPLNSIIILIQTLIRKPDELDEQQLKSLEIIYLSSQDLLELINDLLDMARIEAGEIKVHFDQYSVVDLVERIQTLFMPIAEDKKLEFIVDLKPGLPKQIYTDIQRLQQIIRNLLSNAFKFTRKGSVTLTVSSESDQINFEVRDTGIGIEENSQAQIFDAFRQVGNSDLSARQGTGLGLSISSQLAEVLGGRIELVSEFGKGSSFTFILPDNRQTINNTIDEEHESEFSSVETQHQPKLSHTKKAWHILGASSNIWTDLSTSKVLLENLDQCELSMLENEELNTDNTQGLIIVLLDVIVKKLQQPAVKRYIETLSESIPVVLISLDQSIPTIKWLEILATQSLVWSDESKKHILRLVTKKQTLPTKVQVADDSPDGQYVFTGKKTILIVEDDMRSLFSLSQLLKQSGLETELSDNLALAEEKLKTLAIDAVITDLVLPDGDGLSLIKTIRNNQRYLKIPVIVVSAKNLEEEKENCIKAGANYYFDKPIDVTQLLSVLHEVLENNHG